MSLIPKKGTVYVVDDDEAVRDSLQWLLEGKDYRVRCYDSAESFISRYDPREVACLIADIRMGGMSGLELHKRLLAQGQKYPVIFMSGECQPHETTAVQASEPVAFLWKPFNTQQLLQAIEKAQQQLVSTI